MTTRTILAMLVFCHASLSTGYGQDSRIVRFDPRGVIALVADSTSGLDIWLGYDPPANHVEWSTTVDPALVPSWLDNAHATVAYRPSADSSFLVMSPTLPNLGTGFVAIVQRRRGREWGGIELVYQEHPDSQAVATRLTGNEARQFLLHLGAEAEASRWVRPQVADPAHPFPTNYRDLQAPPEQVRCPTPRYPRSLRRVGTDGTVWLEFIVGPDGRTDRRSIKIIYATESSFADSARRVIAGCRWRPAQYAGGPVSVWVNQTVTYLVQR